MTARPCIALAGNPNTGKTTLFNRLTGRQGRVGNYPGVTVELLQGELKLPNGTVIDAVDVPGSYSLLVRSEEERVAITRLGLGTEHKPDLIVVCVDATNLLRNLYLVLQLQEIGENLLVALTMVDELGAAQIDARALEDQLGCPVVPVSAPTGKGMDALKQAIAQRLAEPERSPRTRWQPSAELAEELARIRHALPKSWHASDGHALWALQSYGEQTELPVPPELREVLAASKLEGPRVDDEAICGRYAFLDTQVGPLAPSATPHARTARVDSVLIHPVAGLFVFLLMMGVLFQSLFAWADPAISLVEFTFGAIADGVRSVLPAGLFTDFLVDGVIGGVGSVVVFLPQILLLFFFIGLMEDSGYMARVAYLMDRVMRTMGLHGRAFVPMLSGFACAVPAIMATRTMERQRDRVLTMMVIPLMTCSARLPVYTLIIGALFPTGALLGFVSLPGAIMVGMYAFSVVMALLAAFVLSKTALRAEPVPLVLELPPYRMPRVRDVLRMMWRRTRYFLSEAGTVILACTVVLWALLTFPREVPLSRDYDAAIASAASEEQAVQLAHEKQGEELRGSFAGHIGKAIEPVIAPLGFDWKIGIGLIGAFAAREVFVATLGVVYSTGDEVDEQSTTLRERMRAEMRPDGRPVYSPLTGLSLMVFFALACQCMSTLAVVKRETHGYKWPAFLLAYMSVLAWVASFIVYQGGRLLGFA